MIGLASTPLPSTYPYSYSYPYPYPYPYPIPLTPARLRSLAARALEVRHRRRGLDSEGVDGWMDGWKRGGW